MVKFHAPLFLDHLLEMGDDEVVSRKCVKSHGY